MAGISFIQTDKFQEPFRDIAKRLFLCTKNVPAREVAGPLNRERSFRLGVYGTCKEFCAECSQNYFFVLAEREGKVFSVFGEVFFGDEGNIYVFIYIKAVMQWLGKRTNLILAGGFLLLAEL
ncbi:MULTISPECIES: hypothetical protein [unclassified Maridesulfovibrio]|uniref:hypothetical protein n=1 Tax=unclassified Maridesulfovibrio TaxID=2794999 RepID=UPI003B3F2DAA